jgi:hypothetical protein
MTPRFFTTLALLFLPAIASAADRMVLGTNFWNIGWHNPSDCFTDFRKVEPQNPWNEQFLKEIAVFRVLRFMDWDVANNSTRSKWTERNAKTNPKQNPVAYEWMIDLCNRNKADMWVTVPHLAVTRSTGDAPADYTLRLCLLVKTGVDMKDVDLTPLLPKLSGTSAGQLIAAGGVRTCDPLDADLKLYVEYSNETWNGGFKQAHYCTEEGTALDLSKDKWTAGFRYHAWAALRCFRAADLVYGDRSPRAVRVLATQSANPWIATQHLAVVKDAKLNPWNLKPDAIATAPYFGHSVDGAAPDAAERLRAEIKKSAEQSAKHKQLADANGMRLIAYEGGQHLTKNAQSLNRSPEMHALYADYLKEMSPHFDCFAHYCHAGRAGNGGAWGAIEQTGKPIEESPKYRALVEWARQR